MKQQLDGARTAQLTLHETALANARTLARQGRYAEAQQLLDQEWGDDEASAACLDLRARIHAQQGQLDEADACWAQAERLRPDEKEFTAGRRRIARLRTSRRVRAVAVARPLALTLALAFVAVLLFAVHNDISETRRDQRQLANQLRGADRRQAPSTTPRHESDILGDLHRQLRLPGVRMQRLPHEVMVTFKAGLFHRGTTLTPDGRAALDGLGSGLRRHADEVTVDVVGHTDSRAVRGNPDYRTNIELGAARAVIVREILRQASGIPTARFSLSTAGSALPPNGGTETARPADPSASRTVSIRVAALPG